MSDEAEKQRTNTQESTGKSAWSKPDLIRFGPVQGLTLGSGGTMGDGGGTMTMGMGGGTGGGMGMGMNN